MKLKASVVLMLLLYSITTAYAAGRVKILKAVVECSGDDLISPRVCFALKEKIRASPGFELITTDEPGSFKVSLVGIKTDDSGLSSAISEVIKLRAAAKFDIFITQYVLICGANAVDATADGIIADLEEQSESMR